MRHRGPDDAGVTSRSIATLGSRRLAIFDPAHGHQPMSSPDGRWTIVFNGAIYNFRALRRELVSGGWTFQSDCDTEVLLAAFAAWGPRCLRRLRGMFAFAVWDEREQTLFAARDPFGIKPLYYRQAGPDLLFASELNAMIASGAVAADIDPNAVADYLAWFAVPAPATIYRGVFSLGPGESATFRNSRLAVDRWWQFGDIPAGARPATPEAFTTGLRERLEDTIRAHVLADVPVGAFLSGGLDSAVIVGLMSRLGGSTLRTFSIGFTEPEYSETSAAEATARHFGTHHTTHLLTGATVAHDLDRLLAAMDQPTGDGLNTFYVSEAARRGGVTVALSGLGGDELFGGYPSFHDTPRLARWLPAWRRAPVALRSVLIGRLRRGDTRNRKLADVLEHATTIHDVCALQRRVFSETARRELLHPDVAAALRTISPLHPALPVLAAELAQVGAFDAVSAWELRTYMADVLLRDSDIMSMRHSLELRVPFVDRPLIEWLWQQPGRSTSGTNKSALFGAVSDLLPADLRQRRKRGFTLPFAVWMRSELRPFLEETFSDASIARSGFFARESVQDLWRGYLTRNDTREWSRVWSLAVLIAFANRQTPPMAGASNGVDLTPGTEIRGSAQKKGGGAPPPCAADGDVAATVASLPPSGSARSPRRTLVLCPEIYASEGGIPRILQLYVRALCESAGTERRIRLVTLNDRPADCVSAQRTFDGTLETVRGCGRNKVAFVREALALARSCDTLVCGHVGQLPVAWLARRFNRSLRYFLVAHGIEVWRRFNAAERAALRGAERIFCVSEYTRGELLRNCRVPADRVIVLPNALDPRFHIAAGEPLAACEPLILAVTRVTYADRYKGIQHLIEAMPAIRQAIPAARLRIIGRGDDVPRLTRLCAELGLGPAVEFAGYVDDERLASELRACRLFALPSRKEGFGLVFLEAMAHGRPCLGAQAGGIPEVITPDTGVLVDYGDVPGIARAAIEALRRDWNQDAILARAREFSFAPFRDRLSAQLAA